jgi:Mannosyltransferase (PIG-V)
MAADEDRPSSGDPASSLTVIALALALRVLSAAIAFLANILFTLPQREPFTVFSDRHVFWDTFARFDSGWYFGIARNGYQFVEGGRSNLAFFPVYPTMMGWLGRLFGGRQQHYYMAGVLISWVAFVLAMLWLRKLAALDLRPRDADRAVLLAAVFPFAFFYGVVYSESVFLLFLVLSCYGFRTRRWWLGGIAGALMTATRVNGIMAVPALAWMARKALTATDTPRDRLKAAAALVTVCAGLGAYSLFVYSMSGSFTEWAASIRRWGYYPGGFPFSPFVRMITLLVTGPYEYLTGEGAAPYDLLNGGTALAFAASVPLIWRRFGAGYGLLMLANLWLPLSAGVFEGMGRYCAVLFPFFIWAASLKSRGTYAALLIGSALLYTLCLALFTTIRPLF